MEKTYEEELMEAKKEVVTTSTSEVALEEWEWDLTFLVFLRAMEKSSSKPTI
jgi:hypothetical protein